MASTTSIPDIAAALADCASGRELIGIGYTNDVHAATSPEAGHTIPALGAELHPTLINCSRYMITTPAAGQLEVAVVWVMTGSRSPNRRCSLW